jgi:hypothetical protein
MEIDNLVDDSNFATALTAASTNSRSQFFLSVVAGPGQWTLRVSATDMASRAGRAMSVVNAGVGHTS